MQFTILFDQFCLPAIIERWMRFTRHVRENKIPFAPKCYFEICKAIGLIQK